MTMKLFVPITKVDETRQEVYGVLAEEALDKANEIFDYASSKPLFQEWSATIAKASDGKSVGNLRAMHGKVAAGKFTQIEYDDDNRRVVVAAKVVDPVEWEKVREGVYTGFSIGGAYEKRWADPTNPAVKRYTARPAEGSLVDNPCMPGATFAAIKSDGTEELRKFAGTEEGEDAAEPGDVEKAEEGVAQQPPNDQAELEQAALKVANLLNIPPTDAIQKIQGAGMTGVEVLALDAQGMLEKFSDQPTGEEAGEDLAKDTVIVQAGTPVVQESDSAAVAEQTERQVRMEYTLSDLWVELYDIKYMIKDMYKKLCPDEAENFAEYAARAEMTKAMEGTQEETVEKTTTTETPQTEEVEKVERPEEGEALTKAMALINEQSEELRKAVDKISQLEADLEKLKNEPTPGGPILNVEALLKNATVVEKGLASDSAGSASTDAAGVLKKMIESTNDPTVRQALSQELALLQIKGIQAGAPNLGGQ